MGWGVKKEAGKVSGLSSARLSPRVPKRLTGPGWTRAERNAWETGVWNA